MALIRLRSFKGSKDFKSFKGFKTKSKKKEYIHLRFKTCKILFIHENKAPKQLKLMNIKMSESSSLK